MNEKNVLKFFPQPIFQYKIENFKKSVEAVKELFSAAKKIDPSL